MSAPLEIETHPFPALLPPQATVMMMGTFPPKEDKRAMQFHYPNFQNDMWRVYGLVFFNDAAHFQRSSEKAFCLVYTLNKKCITSPSCTTYSLPSTRILPASLALASPPSNTKSS